MASKRRIANLTKRVRFLRKLMSDLTMQRNDASTELEVVKGELARAVVMDFYGTYLKHECDNETTYCKVEGTAALTGMAILLVVKESPNYGSMRFSVSHRQVSADILVDYTPSSAKEFEQKLEEYKKIINKL